jgi:hypothetical protein
MLEIIKKTNAHYQFKLFVSYMTTFNTRLAYKR